MNKILRTYQVFVAILVIAVSPSPAQTVSTPIVGFSKVTVPVGTRAVVPGFVKAAVISGSGLVAGQNVSTSGLTANALQPTSFGDRPNYPTHYLEITSGAYEGYSFDVSGNTSTSVTVSGLPSALNGTTINYVLRPHLTLGDIDSSNLPDGNVILNIFNNPDVATVTYLYDSAGTWYDSNGNTIMNHAVIYPGTGISLNNSASQFQLNFSGQVKATKTVVPLYKQAVVNFVGPMNPGTTSTFTSWAAPLPVDSIANIMSVSGNNGVSLSLLTDLGSTVLYDGNGDTLSSVSIDGQNAFGISAMGQDGYAVFTSPLAP